MSATTAAAADGDAAPTLTAKCGAISRFSAAAAAATAGTVVTAPAVVVAVAGIGASMDNTATTKVV